MKIERIDADRLELTLFVLDTPNRELGLVLRAMRDAASRGDVAALGALPFRVRVRRVSSGRRQISPATRRRIIARDKHCQFCEATNNLEIDHVVPVVHGGTDDDENLQALCRPCNRLKGPAPYERRRMVARG